MSQHSTFFSLLGLAEDATDEQIERRTAELIREYHGLERLEETIRVAVEVLRDEKLRICYLQLVAAARSRTAIPANSQVIDVAEAWGFKLLQDRQRLSQVFVFFADEAPIDDEPAIHIHLQPEQQRANAVQPDLLYHVAYMLGFARSHVKILLGGGVLLAIVVAGIYGLPKLQDYWLCKRVDSALAADTAQLKAVDTSLLRLFARHEELVGIAMGERLVARDDRVLFLADAVANYPSVEAAVDRLRATTAVRQQIDGLRTRLDQIEVRVREAQYLPADRKELSAIGEVLERLAQQLIARHADLDHVTSMMKVAEYDRVSGSAPKK